MFSLFYDTTTSNNDENNAAITIQKVTRGYLVRKKHNLKSVDTNDTSSYETIDNVTDDKPKLDCESESESESDSSDSESEISVDDENAFYILHVDDKPLSYILSDRKDAYKTMWKYARRIKFNHSIDKRCFIREKRHNELEIVGSYRLFAVTIDHMISKLKLYKVYVKI